MFLVDLTRYGAVVTPEPAGDLSKLQLEHLEVRNHVALFTGKLYVGHGGCLLAGGLVALLTLPNTRHVLPAIKWCG